jgi:CDP-glucose 4,6-dehydratase
MVTASFRASFFTGKADADTRVATARAGNVIGGGDWSPERLVPDCLNAFAAGQPVLLRFPHAVRPWQHVLEPLSGYLTLAQKLFGVGGCAFARPWNFGPNTESNATVAEIARMTARNWSNSARVEFVASDDNPHETSMLRLDSTQSRRDLQWCPRWPLEQSIQETVAWFRAWKKGADMRQFSLAQIARYESAPAS